MSKLEYKEHFILKGGIFLYALYDGSYTRATTNIDFLVQRISNGTEKIKLVFAEIFSIEADDSLRFDLETLSVKNIAEMKKYHGMNVSITDGFSPTFQGIILTVLSICLKNYMN